MQSLKAMTLAESSISDDSERSEEKIAISKESHIKRWWRWKHNPPQALVLRQEDTHLGVEEINEANSKLSLVPYLFHD